MVTLNFEIPDLLSHANLENILEGKLAKLPTKFDLVVADDLSIFDLKCILLGKTENKPFFLEWNINNEMKVKDLVEKNKGTYFLIFTNLDVFTLDIESVSGKEGLIIRNLRMTDTLGDLGKNMEIGRAHV